MSKSKSKKKANGCPSSKEMKNLFELILKNYWMLKTKKL